MVNEIVQSQCDRKSLADLEFVIRALKHAVCSMGSYERVPELWIKPRKHYI